LLAEREHLLSARTSGDRREKNFARGERSAGCVFIGGEGEKGGGGVDQEKIRSVVKNIGGKYPRGKVITTRGSFRESK